MKNEIRYGQVTRRVICAAALVALVLPSLAAASGLGFFFATKNGNERWSAVNPSKYEYFALFIAYTIDGAFYDCEGAAIAPNGEWATTSIVHDDEDALMEAIVARTSDGDTLYSPGIHIDRKRSAAGGPIPYWVFSVPQECSNGMAEGDCEDEFFNCARCAMEDEGVETDTLANYGIPGGACETREGGIAGARR